MLPTFSLVYNTPSSEPLDGTFSWLKNPASTPTKAPLPAPVEPDPLDSRRAFAGPTPAHWPPGPEPPLNGARIKSFIVRIAHQKDVLFITQLWIELHIQSSDRSILSFIRGVHNLLGKVTRTRNGEVLLTVPNRNFGLTAIISDKLLCFDANRGSRNSDFPKGRAPSFLRWVFDCSPQRHSRSTRQSESDNAP